MLNQKNTLIIASRDYHPDNHYSFKKFGSVFPPHCLQGSKGSKIIKPLSNVLHNIYIKKSKTSRDCL